MRTHRKILIDTILGGTLARIANTAAVVLGRILHRPHRLPSSYRTIAVCKLVGIGSIVQATPMLASLKKSFPNARIVFISAHGNKELLQRIPAVDSIICIDDRSVPALIATTVYALFALKLKGVSCYFDLEIYSHFSSLLTVLSCARYRFGYYKTSIGARNGIYTHLMYFNIKAPVASVYRHLAAVSGCSSFHETLTELRPSKREQATVAKLCSDKKIPSSHRIVAINPNASDLRIERRWQPEAFAELSTRLIQRYNDVFVVFIGSASEKKHVQTIIDLIPDHSAKHCCSMAGVLSLGELLALFQHATLFITNDSGPLHLAATLKKNIIALFGPCSPDQYGLMPGVTTVYRNVYCSPCVHEFILPPCRGDNACMKAVSVDEVDICVISLLENKEVQRQDRTITYRHCITSEPLGIVQRDR